MKFSQEVAAEILAVLETRGAPKACSLCGVKQWALGSGFYFLPVQGEFPTVNYGTSGMPCAGLVCQNCGNVQLVNLLPLGLSHLWRKETDPSGKVE